MYNLFSLFKIVICLWKNCDLWTHICAQNCVDKSSVRLAILRLSWCKFRPGHCYSFNQWAKTFCPFLLSTGWSQEIVLWVHEANYELFSQAILEWILKITHAHVHSGECFLSTENTSIYNDNKCCIIYFDTPSKLQ